MENKEFNLSERIYGYDPITQLVVKGDVKEFIKQIKEKMRENVYILQVDDKDCVLVDLKRKLQIIDKLAGDKLI